MKTSRTTLLLATTALAGAVFAADEAGAQSATIQVSAFVEEDCTISTDPIPLNFGTYDPDQFPAHTETSEFGFSCPSGKSVTFTLEGGEPDGSGDRFLPNIDDATSPDLRYNLADPFGGTWTDGYIVESTAGGAETRSFVGYIYPGQDEAKPGNYYHELTLSMTVNPS